MNYKKNSLIRTGAFALIDMLVKHKVKNIFGYPGGAILPIYDELYHWEKKKLIKHYLVRHEQSAAHAADAYARATNEVGVCLATSGPGATNLVTGLATAHMDSVPLIAITGQVSRAFIGTDAFQEVDIFGITLPIVKHSFVVRDPKDIAKIVSEAFYISKHGRPGTVLIDVPKDVGLEEFDYHDYDSILSYTPTTRCRPIPGPSIRQIEKFKKMLSESKQPILYVGGGAVTSRAQHEIEELASFLKIPVTTTLMGKGCFNEYNPLYLGMLGMHGTAYANFAISECDLLIALGARFDDRVTGKLDEFACNAQVIHVDIDPAEIGKNRIPQLAIISDVKMVLKELLQAIKKETNNFDKNQTQAWLHRIHKWKKEYPLSIPSDSKLLYPQEVMNEISQIARQAFFATDVGQHQMWAAQFLKVEQGKWLSSSGLGTMGYGLPAAIGTKIANPNSLVICITGDSSFQMNLQELGTIAQYELDIKIFIINNQWQGMVRQWQQAFYGQRYSHSNMAKGQPNFVQLANSYGIEGIRVTTSQDLKSKFERIISNPGPIVIDCLVATSENCYPMIAPGKSNSQMLGLAKQVKSITN